MVGLISVEQRARFEADGFLRLPGFVAPAACDALRTRAAALVDAVDADELGSVFSTRDQVRTTDDYFLDSGDQVRCFLEEDAVDDAGRLRRDKALAINKIGHALHDLDPVFDGFSRTAELAALAKTQTAELVPRASAAGIDLGYEGAESAMMRGDASAAGGAS